MTPRTVTMVHIFDHHHLTSQRFDHRSVQHVFVKYGVVKGSLMHHDRPEFIARLICRLGEAWLSDLKNNRGVKQMEMI